MRFGIVTMKLFAIPAGLILHLLLATEICCLRLVKNQKPSGTSGHHSHVVKSRSIKEDILAPHNLTAEYPAPKEPAISTTATPVINEDKEDEEVDSSDSYEDVGTKESADPDILGPSISDDTEDQLSVDETVDSGESGNNDQLVNFLNKQIQLEQQQSQLASADTLILFTIANTDTKRNWSQLPYREKFQWTNPNAPCYQFDLTVPDERQGHGIITLCIYRRKIDNARGSGIITHEDDKHVDLFEQREIKVYGHVVDFPESEVSGRIVQTYFYGEISLVDPVTGDYFNYVVEEIKLLAKLFHQSRQLFHNIIEVVHNAVGKNVTDPSTIKESQFNAVVTRGASLFSFMLVNNQNSGGAAGGESFVPMPVVVLTTHHNSYIMAGQPKVIVDEKGQMKFASPGGSLISLEADGSILLTTQHRIYTFRPYGATMLKEGVVVNTLQEKEGSLAISAVSNRFSYGCVLPSHSFTVTRKGGYLCKVCLTADQQFQEMYLPLIGRNGTSAIAFLSEVIDQVSWILRATDWNNDGHPDNIGLDYDTQFTSWQYEDDKSESVSEETLEVLFQSLSSLDFSECCLGIAYTMKKFPNDVYAKASSSTPSEPGGICAFRSGPIFKNVILMSAANSKSLDPDVQHLTPAQLVYLTAHEIGKAFGSSFDTTGQLGCDAFLDPVTKEQKHYILWPDVLRGNITIEEKSFSSCSKKAVVETLDSCKSWCFLIDLNPFCGNGIQEEGEECDCGSEQNCSKQICCYGRTGKYPCRKTGFGCGENSSSTLIPSLAAALVLLLSPALVHIWSAIAT